MSPELWKRVRDALERLLGLSKPGQAELLRELRRDDPEICSEVESLLDQQTVSQRLESPPTQTLEQAPPSQAATRCPAVPGYEMLGVLGRGGMGVVYKARHRVLQRLVALKMIRGGAGDAQEIARFRTEAESVARLQHPNIVQIFEVGEHEGEPFLSLEFVNGGSLADHIKKNAVPPRLAAQFVAGLARAMHYAHEHGIVHRDLKPANILLDFRFSDPSPIENQKSKIENAAPKITDFGLAKRLGDNSGQTRTGAVMGTPAYMAPEQAAGKTREIGPAADIYSLGAILYELVAGRPPFAGDSVLDVLEQVRTREPLAPTRLQPKLHRDLETICLKAMAKEPARRYATAQALADDLDRFHAGELILARPVGRLQKAWYRAMRRPWLVAASLAAALVVAGAALWYSNWSRERDQQAGLVNEIEAALVTPEIALAHVRNIEAKIDELEILNAEQAASKRANFRKRLKETLEITLDRMKGEAQSYEEWKGVLAWLETVAPADAEPVRRLQKNRESGWEEVASLNEAATQASVDRIFGPGQATLKDKSVLPAATGQGPAPIAYASFLSQNNAEIAAVFGPGWDTAPTVGVWLNAVFGHTGPVRSLAFSRDGKTLFSAGGDPDKSAEVIAWELPAGRIRFTHKPDKPGLLCIAQSPREDILAVGNSNDGSVALLDARNGQLARQLDVFPEGGTSSVAFAPGGATLAVGGGIWQKSGEVQIWDAASWQPQGKIAGHAQPIGRLAYSPDGQLLATCAADARVKVWEVASKKEVFSSAPLELGFTPHARFTKDSKKLLANANADKTRSRGMAHPLLIWDRDTGKAVQDLDIGMHAHGLAGMALSPDGETGAFSTSWGSQFVELFDLGKRRKLRTLTEVADSHLVQFTHLALEYSPDGSLLAAGTQDAKVKVWHVSSGNLRTFERLGYGFSLRPISGGGADQGPNRDDSLKGARLRHEKLNMTILRHGVVLAEQALTADLLPDGPLKLVARREGDKLVFQVASLAPLEFKDLLPWTDGGAGRFAVQCGRDVRLEKLSLLRLALPAQPSPLERGDSLLAQGQFDEALSAYRALAQTAGTSEAGKEAQFKMATCLLSLQRRDEAAQVYEKLVSQAGERWAAAAGCQLLLVRAQQGRLEEADALLEALSQNHGVENLGPLVSKDLRDRLGQFYVRDFHGVDLMYKPRAIDFRHLERVKALFDFLKVPADDRLALDISFLRAYHRSGQLDKADQIAQKVLSQNLWERDHNYIAFMSQASWVLRQRGRAEQALAFVDRYLFRKPGEFDPKFIHLVPERVRILVSLGRLPQAEADLDDYLKQLQHSRSYVFHGSACLLQGFIRRQQGDEAGAQQSWRKGMHKNWCAEFAKLDPNFDSPPLGRADGAGLLVGMILAALANDFPDEESDHLLHQIAQRAAGDSPFGIVRDRLPLPPGILRKMWQTPRGLACARKIALQDLTYEDYLRLPLVLVLTEFMHHGAMPEKLSPDQESILWALGEKLHQAHVSGKLTQPQMFGIILAWKGTTNFLGWGGVAPTLDPEIRGPLAYIAGFRYRRLSREADAQTFFQTALRDASPGSPLARLAQAEIKKAP